MLWLASVLGRFIPGEAPPLCTTDTGTARDPPGWFQEEKNLLCLPGIDKRFFGHAAHSLITIAVMLFHCNKDPVIVGD